MRGATVDRKPGALVRYFPPHIAFLWIAAINLCLLCVLMPPFQVHDEFQHLFRAYQLSEGRLLGGGRDGVPGGRIPVSILNLVRRDWGTLAIWRIMPAGRHPLADTWSGFLHPLVPARRQFTEFLTADYAPILYLPQIVGVGLGRMLGTSPLILLLLGRIANAAASVTAIAFALRRMPYGGTAALAFALLPGAQIEYASVAPDASIIAAGFVLVALILDNDRRGAWSRRDIVIGVVAATILCSKLVYAPLLAAGVPGAWRQARTRGMGATTRPLVAPQLMIAAVGLGVGLLWFFGTAGHLSTPDTSHGQIIAKMIAIWQHPVRFVTMLGEDFPVHGVRYIFDFVGILGARTLVLPQFVYPLALAALLLSALIARGPARPRSVACFWWYVATVMSTIALVQTAMFLLNTKIDDWRIVGVQGRYLLPIGGLAAAAATQFRRPEGEPGIGYALLLAALVGCTIGLDVGTIFGFHLF